MGWEGKLKKIDDYRWEIPVDYKTGMRVPGLVFADEAMLKQIMADKAPDQVANVAFLPGIVRYSMAMPDIHWGYGDRKSTRLNSSHGYISCAVLCFIKK